VAVVRSDDQIAISHMFQNIRQIIARLASDIDMIVLEQISIRPGLPSSAVADLRVIHHVGKPLGAELDKRPA